MITDVWQHKKSKAYYILVTECKVKNKLTRDWEDGYIYYKSGAGTGVFVRTVVEFLDKFELINERPGNVKFVNVLRGKINGYETERV